MPGVGIVWGNFPPRIPTPPRELAVLRQAVSCSEGRGWGIDGTGSPHSKLTWHGDGFWFPSSGWMLEAEGCLEEL